MKDISHPQFSFASNRVCSYLLLGILLTFLNRSLPEALSDNYHAQDASTYSFSSMVNNPNLPIYWVNLDSAKARNHSMSTQFLTRHIYNNRVSATTVTEIFIDESAFIQECTTCLRDKINCKRGIKPTSKYTHEIFQTTKSNVVVIDKICSRPINTMRELACTVSHLRAINKAIAKPTKDYAIMMEDDVILPFDVDFDAV
jgi:hypothetical protein